MLALKGGAILDMLVKRRPKDYDLMNLGMSNAEFMLFLTRFVRDTKPAKIEFVPGRVVLFRVTMSKDKDDDDDDDNSNTGDVLEFVLNVDTTRAQLCTTSNLPDQLCYLPSERKLFANDYTLAALNYGYCELDVERRSTTARLSKKLNKLGFNFYFKQPFVNNNSFLKERLERYIWSVSQLASVDAKNASYASGDDKKTKLAECVVKKGKVYADEKLVFTSVDEFMAHMKSEADKIDEKLTNNKNNETADLRIVEFKGAIILPQKTVNSNPLAFGLDWSF